jgi:hypothetical protein
VLPGHQQIRHASCVGGAWSHVPTAHKRF